ncbi:protein of unknown function [Agrococcus baldri]|uniref:DUF1206 domain-containing protein n=1 Tax=Agrococcus baldri TaxID=153730 RepID=A0AA94HM28_9MICO|nr:DUF1206 domain-containing protein [Agrococcus baldri]SFS09309.1 protein of unknown function [Agrococcus baldri]
MASSEGLQEPLSDAADAASHAAHKAQRAAAGAEEHRATSWVESVGQSANGVVHMVIGGIALGIAFGAGGPADQSGAMRAIERTAVGGVALWVVGIALVALALHAFVIAIAESRRSRRDALRAAGRGIGHAVVGGTALVFALGGEVDGEQATETVSSAVMASPAGLWVIGAAGLVIVGVGVAFVLRGLRRKFFEDVAPPRRFRRLVEALGMPGFVSKGVAIGIVGVLFVLAAVRHEPDDTGGLDGALQSLTTVPGGVIALVAIAIGLIVYGAYCVVRGIWAR